jgi:hypothetical protein
MLLRFLAICPVLCIPGILLFLGACDSINRAQADGDMLLAEVYNHKLYQSEFKNAYPEFTSESDSLMRLRIYVENWVRDKLLLNQAEKYVSDKLDIDKLVDDYRASLMVHHYEKEWVESRIDTSLNVKELLEYYDENQDQYQLEKTILRCHFIKFEKAIARYDSLRIWWNSNEKHDFIRLVEFCNEQAELYMLDEEVWYKVDEITQLLPAGSLSESSMRPGRTYNFSDQDYSYFIRILESVQKQETAPFTYIQEQAMRYIMHQRKLTLLEQMKNELYRKELDGREIKIYID